MRGSGNMWIGAIILAALAVIAMWLFAADNGGVYFTKTTSDTQLKVYPVLYYHPADGKSVSLPVTVQIENLGSDDVTYLVKTSDSNTSETLDVSAGKTEKMRVEFKNISTAVPKLVTKSVSVYRNSEDSPVAQVPVYVVVGTAPKVDVKTDKNDDIIGQKFIVADTGSDSFIIYADVNDSATVQDINVSVPDNAPIAITAVTYTEQTLNSNTWEKVVVNYKVKDSALKGRLYDMNYTVDIGYDGNVAESATVPAEFVYKGPEDLAQKYDTVFAEIENVG